MARVGLSRPKALHGLEIVGQGIETSKYDAFGSIYADTYDVRTSRSAYFEFVSHGQLRQIPIEATKGSQMHNMPRIDGGALMTFESLAIPMGLLERGGSISRNATQRPGSPASLRSFVWGENPEHENEVRSEVNEPIDIKEASAKNGIKTGSMSSSFQGYGSSAEFTVPDRFPAEVMSSNVQRETVCEENKKLPLQICKPNGNVAIPNNNQLPIWNRRHASSDKRQRNLQSPIFRSAGVYKNPWSAFHCHSDAAESFRGVVAPLKSAFPVRHFRKSSQSPRPLSSITPNSHNQKSQSYYIQMSARSLPSQSSSHHNTLVVVGHSSNSPQGNTQPMATTGTAEVLSQRTTDFESRVFLGPRGVKLSSRSRGRITQRSEALSEDRIIFGRATNEICVTDSAVVTNGYSALKRSPPKSRPTTTSPTSTSHSTLENSQPKPRNSDSPYNDQNGGRTTVKSGCQPHRSRTASRTSFEKSNGTFGISLSEEKDVQSSNSDSVQTASNRKQVFCDMKINKEIVLPIPLKLNGFSNPDENRNKVLTVSNSKVESCRNGVESSTVSMENSENQLRNLSASAETSKTRIENFRNPMENSTGAATISTATGTNSDISGTALENSKVSFVNKVTVCLSPTPRVTPRSLSRSTQLHSIQSPEPGFNLSIDISSDPTCNNSSYNNNEKSTDERQNCNNHLNEAQSQQSDSTTLIPEKDGRYFLNLVEQVESDMKIKCVELEKFLEGVIPDEASGKIRAAIGKANLLMTKKFKQFRELCNKNLTQSHEDQFQTTSEDLTGYWDLVQLQVDEIQRLFDDIHSLHSNNWIDSDPQTVNVPLSPKATEVRPKEQATQSAKKPKSSKANEVSKAREESRKRLMAAKMAGRQRKASETEEEIQIFIS